MTRGSKNLKKTGGQSRLPEENIIYVILDPIFFLGVLGIGVFIVLNFLKYLFLEYILLDNYSTIYLMNDI